jgi:hypothetical protein
MSKPRNLKVDLEICNRASKAPWRVATNKHPTTSGNSWGWVEGTRENWCWSNDNKKSYADARFIAQAREGWPYAIERALKAEELNRELVEVLEGVQRLKPLIAYPDEVLPEFEEEAMAIANMLNVVDSIIAKSKEVLGDEVYSAKVRELR